MDTERVSEPSVSVRAEEISSGIASPRKPVPSTAEPTSSVGTSATPSTPTVMMPVVGSDVLSPSVVTTETPIGISTSLLAGGVICKPSRSASLRTTVPSSLTVIGPLALARTAPSGMPDRVISAVSLSSALSMEIGKAMAVSSSPTAVSKFRAAPSATPATSTEIEPSAASDTSPSSVVVVDTAISKAPEKLAGGRTARPSNSPSARVTVPSSLTATGSPLRRITAPWGMLDRVTDRVSEPSVSSSATSTVIGIRVSSKPVATVSVTTAPSATP